MNETRIRPARTGDGDAVAAICLRTAQSGSDATGLYSNERLPGLTWALPYLEFPGATALVVDRPDGVAGYLVGAADSVAFEHWFTTQWRRSALATLGDLNPRTELDRRDFAYLTREPEPHAGWQEDYPAHLHINLLPVLQGQGWGRVLIEAFLAEMRAQGMPGVALGVADDNQRARDFYMHLGFREIPESGGMLGIRIASHLRV